MKVHEIRADYDDETITVYQAYNRGIAQAAIKQQKFVAPFSFNRMTWIKPSFLWMMERCGYAQKEGQEVVLALRLKREKWEYALSQAALSHPAPEIYKNEEEWRRTFDGSLVRIQWDPERDIKGAKLEQRSIQVGISRHLIQEFSDEWIVEIKDYTPLVEEIRGLRQAGRYDEAQKLLPIERPYPLPIAVAKVAGVDLD